MNHARSLTNRAQRDPLSWTPEPRSWVPPWWAWILTAGALVILAASGLYFRPPGSMNAVWWPAAGVGVWFVLVNPTRRRPAALAVIGVVVFAVNLSAGRGIDTAIGYALANVTEALVISLLLGIGGRRFVLVTITHALRFFFAVVVGAAAMGVVMGMTTALTLGGDFAASAIPVTASHAAAILLIAPFALVPARGVEAFSWVEVGIQTLILAAAIYFVFRPGAYLPLAFLPFTIVTWAAFRFPMRIAFGQSILVAVAVLFLSFRGGGPFGAMRLSPVDLAVTVDVFLIALAAITVLLVAARHELRRATRLAARTTRLVTGGLVNSAIGLLIIEHDQDASRVVWGNAAGRDLLGDAVTPDGLWSGPLEVAARTAVADGVETVRDHGDIVLRLIANAVPGEPHLFAVQLVDVTSTVRLTQARIDAELERHVARATRIDLERQREDFVATTSHELRTPITSLRGYTELLVDSPNLPDTERAWVQVIDRNAERLSELVEDLLALGRARRAPLDETAVDSRDARDYVADVVLTQRPVADAKRLSVEVDSDGPVFVRAVPRDALHALGNLVSNALKFTPPGGSVRLRVRRDGDEAVMSVTDTGPGMSAETMAHAFERFYRAPQAERASTPGTGLGLAIAREAAERNGGTIVLSSPEGGGLTAELRLPLGSACQTPDADAASTDRCTSGTIASSTTSSPR